IDLADWDHSRAIHLPGQSGHPASQHYDDLIEPWMRGEYHELLWSRANVEMHAQDKLTLTP
ncbi:partial Acyl-homoserine lactone acylase QuiP, partial [Anaerolineae bacterium]